jgi:hypothetical protein
LGKWHEKGNYRLFGLDNNNRSHFYGRC